ncbi:MAG: hypothetical protein SNJ72_10605, partial [Fimbriimonadales bacterium]
MAKPIPINRRWKPDAPEQQSTQSEPVQPSPALVLRPLRVISARLESICHACLQTIQIGQQIAHRESDDLWVHLECVNRLAIPRGHSILRARYTGFCFLCDQTVPIG